MIVYGASPDFVPGGSLDLIKIGGGTDFLLFICASAAVSPSGVIIVTPNKIYDRLLIVEYASRLFRCVSFNARLQPYIIVKTEKMKTAFFFFIR